MRINTTTALICAYLSASALSARVVEVHVVELKIDGIVHPVTAEIVNSALGQASREHADAILLDAELANGSGLQERIAEWDPDAHVLLVTDRYSPESAVDAIRQGACDCLSKPLTTETVEQRVGEVLQLARLRRETLQLDERQLENFRFHGMAGRSPKMLETFARIRRVAPHYRIAMVGGATGTGKELVAHALHELSPVASRRFAVCNCSASFGSTSPAK